MIGALIVLYNPDWDLLNKGLNALLPQVDEVCVVDNSSENNLENFNNIPKIHYIPMLNNVGIASAQNIGIKYFMKQNFDFVVFSDQDSVAEKGLINSLLDVYKELLKINIKVAALGPMPINRISKKAYVTKSNIRTIYPQGELSMKYDILEMYSIISSFSVIKLDCFNEVGCMETELFIDGVDNEWGWRAYNKAKYRSFIVKNLTFSHFQGCDINAKYKKSTPFRTYFQYRNFIVLCKRSYVPIFWKVRNLIKFIIKLIYYPLFVSPRISYIKEICNGIKDGVLNNLGGKSK